MQSVQDSLIMLLLNELPKNKSEPQSIDTEVYPKTYKLQLNNVDYQVNIWIEASVTSLQNQNVLLITLEKENKIGKTVHCLGATLGKASEILPEKAIWDLGLI